MIRRVPADGSQLAETVELQAVYCIGLILTNQLEVASDTNRMLRILLPFFPPPKNYLFPSFRPGEMPLVWS